MKHHSWILMFILCAGAAQSQVQKPVAQKRLNAKLLASDGQAHAGFGYPVAVGGNVIAVANGLTPGSVYLYSRLSNVEQGAAFLYSIPTN